MSEEKRYISAQERYDRLARKFHRETGYFPPGKDIPPELASPYSAEDLLWRLWEIFERLESTRQMRDWLKMERDDWRARYVSTLPPDQTQAIGPIRPPILNPEPPETPA